MKPRIKLTLLVFFLGLSAPVFSQNSEYRQKADSLHIKYEFQKAIDLYESALNSTTDSLQRLKIQDYIIQSENGINLLMFATNPTVINSLKVDEKDFFLNIKDFSDSSWIKMPNPFVKEEATNDLFFMSTYFPKGSDIVYFSAPDSTDSWNIYFCRRLNDTLWTNPEIAGKNLCTVKNEIFPIISDNGKELYFASNGHPGMGGYDLFVSKWDEEMEEWGAPQNLGFPFSSTADDVLFYNSLYNNCSVLASTRDCDPNSINIFVTELQNNPIKTSLSDIKEIQTLHKLLPKVDETPKKKKLKDTESSNAMDSYSLLVAEMRMLQKELDYVIAEQNKDRELYISLTNADDKALLEKKIAQKEEDAIAIGVNLDIAIKNVQEAEMDFLTKGIIPQINDPETEIENEKAKDKREYIFDKINFGIIPLISFETIIPKFDYSFKVLKTAQLAEDNNIPSGIVYQTQLFVVSKKAPLGALKGLSPIFERKQRSGKYLYTVGLWRTHKEALNHLSTIRQRFPGAYIIAYKDGVNISVRDARIQEKSKGSSGSSSQIVIKGHSDGIPPTIISAINQNSSKDIAKTIKDGETIYLIGPFNSRSEAESLLNILTALGLEGASIETIKL